jgi:hypothetical protein
MAVLMDSMKQSLGMMVPVWFPADHSQDPMAGLLRMTFGSADLLLDWSNVVAVVDGAPRAEEALRAIQGELVQESGATFRILSLPENRGKGNALARGFEFL